MTKLLALLGAGFPAIIASFLGFVARKWGTATATIAMAVILTTMFVACINLILSQVLAMLTPPEFIANALGMFMPSNFGAVLGMIVSAKTCRASYDLAMMKAKVFAGSN